MRIFKSLLLIVCVLTFACSETAEQDQVRIDLHLPATGLGADLVISPDGTLTPAVTEVNFEVEGSTRGITIHRIWVDFTIAYNENGRNDTYTRSVDGQLVFGKQKIIVDFPETLGGTITFTNNVTYQQRGWGPKTIRSTPVTVNIVGTQPPKEDIRKYVNDDLFAVVIFRRSTFEQFDAQGKPTFNAGFGSFRIPAPSAEQIWNWTKSVDFAKQDLEQRKTLAKEIPAKLRAQDPVKYADLPDFDAAQLLREAVQSYGKGQYHKAEKSPLTKKWKWVADSNNDGFASKCEAIAKDVANGKFPPGWN